MSPNFRYLAFLSRGGKFASRSISGDVRTAPAFSETITVYERKNEEAAKTLEKEKLR